MRASDVMTTAVITVTPDATVQNTAATLLRHRISAVPVIDEAGRLVGLVSEGDLMRRTEAGTERRRSAWLEAFTSKQTLVEEFIKSHARKVADVMTRNVITIDPDTPIARIAHILERNNIKRVPVVRGGKVLGIVSRANLLQALACLKGKQESNVADDDAQIRRNVLAEIEKQAWTAPTLINVIVRDGTVELWGVVESAAEKTALRVLAESAAGVRAVNDNMLVQRVASGL